MSEILPFAIAYKDVFDAANQLDGQPIVTQWYGKYNRYSISRQEQADGKTVITLAHIAFGRDMAGATPFFRVTEGDGEQTSEPIDMPNRNLLPPEAKTAELRLLSTLLNVVQQRTDQFRREGFID